MTQKRDIGQVLDLGVRQLALPLAAPVVVRPVFEGLLRLLHGRVQLLCDALADRPRLHARRLEKRKQLRVRQGLSAGCSLDLRLLLVNDQCIEDYSRELVLRLLFTCCFASARQPEAFVGASEADELLSRDFVPVFEVVLLPQPLVLQPRASFFWALLSLELLRVIELVSLRCPPHRCRGGWFALVLH